MAVYEFGNRAGIPVVLCHGFPELAYTWRHQITALAGSGYHVIAMDQRGYGATGGPKGPGSVKLYDYETLTADLVGLLDTLDIESAIFIGHDFGSLLSWQMAMRYPNRVRAVASLNIPFSPRPGRDPVGGMQNVYGDDFYIVQFQKHGEAEIVLDADVSKTLRFYYRKRAGSDKPKPERYLYALKWLEEPEESWGGECFLTTEDLDYYAKAFAETGFEGAVNWYRNFTRNWELSGQLEQKIDMPALLVYAADELLPRGLDGDMARYIPNLETRLIEDCGHWTQEEQPEVLNTILLEWLNACNATISKNRQEL